jgi:hypothetical protein
MHEHHENDWRGSALFELYERKQVIVMRVKSRTFVAGGSATNPGDGARAKQEGHR